MIFTFLITLPIALLEPVCRGKGMLLEIHYEQNPPLTSSKLSHCYFLCLTQPTSILVARLCFASSIYNNSTQFWKFFIFYATTLTGGLEI